ncbi:hypothetical protein T4B_3915 [Trichinella pseudospiralis]|nr:hypothetical protein T4B_3915 [Trichinella pseudospiralis]
MPIIRFLLAHCGIMNVGELLLAQNENIRNSYATVAYPAIMQRLLVNPTFLPARCPSSDNAGYTVFSINCAIRNVGERFFAQNEKALVVVPLRFMVLLELAIGKRPVGNSHLARIVYYCSCYVTSAQWSERQKHVYWRSTELFLNVTMAFWSDGMYRRVFLKKPCDTGLETNPKPIVHPSNLMVWQFYFLSVSVGAPAQLAKRQPIAPTSTQRLTSPNAPPPTLKIFCPPPINADEVTLHLKLMSAKPSSGLDGVQVSHLRNCDPVCLAKAFNCFLLARHIPQKLKDCRTTLVAMVPEHQRCFYRVR